MFPVSRPCLRKTEPPPMPEPVKKPTSCDFPLQDKTPAGLLKLPLIPPSLLRTIPQAMRPGPPTLSQKLAIRQILNMRRDAPLGRCRGKSRAKVQRLAAQGDTVHGEREHESCPLCRCGYTAGQYTKGDFYGLGPETGMLGVGLCARCLQSSHQPVGHAVKNARREVEMLQQYGGSKDDTAVTLRVAQEEAALAKQTVKAREELLLVQDTLADFKKMLADVENKPTEMTKAGPVAMCDKTRISLILEIARTLSRLNLDAVRLDASKYVLVEEVLIAAAEIQQAVESSLRLMEELVIAKHVRGEATEAGVRPAYDYCWEKFTHDWAAIWRRLRAKAGRGQG